MQRSIRPGRPWSLTLGLVLTWSVLAGTAGAQVFDITSPPAGAVVSPGETVTLMWTGGDPAWMVDVALIDETVGVVALWIELTGPNDGSLTWVVPSSLPGEGPCGHTYRFYVQESSQATWTYGPEFSVSCGLSVAIDVKPGSFPNSINPRSRGRIPVAVLTTDSFDAASVDPESVVFGPAAASPAKARLDDADGDGDLDLILHFRTQETGIACGDTAAALMGLTYDGQEIEGTDSVKTVGCR